VLLADTQALGKVFLDKGHESHVDLVALILICCFGKLIFGLLKHAFFQ
jgi:hypothetical protein